MSVLNYKHLRHHYMNEYGEHGPLPSRKVKLRDRRAWKSDVTEQMAEDQEVMTEIFIIESSWWIDGADVEGHANLTVWPTEEDAKDELDRLARNRGLTIGPDDTTFEDGDDMYFINRYEIEEI